MRSSEAVWQRSGGPAADSSGTSPNTQSMEAWMRGMAQHGASVVPVVPNLTAPFNDADSGAKSETDAAAALANTALEFSH